MIRLVGPRRVEVHRHGVPVRTALPGGALTAPGVLRNAVPVEALYDPKAAQTAALRNLLQRQGYESLDAVRGEGKAEGKVEGELNALRAAILTVLESRGLAPASTVSERIAACGDRTRLGAWLRRAATATSGDDLFVD